MVLECLGSSSAGNCYLLRSAAETLILECGVDMRIVKEALGWSFSGVVGCLVSHEHKDHAKHIKDIMRCGIPTLALQEVFASQHQQGNPFAKVIKPMHGYKVGGFRVLTLPMAHDVPCLGFVIDHPEMGKTLFATDTMMLEHRIAGLNHIMVEANYADDILQENIDNGVVPPSLRDRLMGTHMELATTGEFIRTAALEDVNEIVLLHLSGNNSDSERFRAEVEGLSGKPVYIARRGLKIAFSKEIY